MSTGAENALDHVVVVMFENRSFDNLLGRLYEPGEVASFEGVIGKDLSNPVPEWAEHRPDDGIVRYGVAPNMNTPNPDSGEELPHINTQLFGTLDEENRGVVQPEKSFNEPREGQAATMDGFVADFISMLMVELGRQPTVEEYSQIMTGYTPEQMPVLSGIARGFATFDHWFCDVPTCTYPNRSFFHAGQSSGYVVNMSPPGCFPKTNDAETLFDRLDAAGLTWRVYCDPPSHYSLTGVIHAPRLAGKFATNFFSTRQFFEDAENGRAAHLRVHRAADHRLEPQRHAPAVRDAPAGGRGGEGRRRCGLSLRPALLPDRRRGPPGAHLQRDPQLLRADRLQPPQHDPAGDLRRARRHLRPRPAAGSRPARRQGRPRPNGLHLQPLRRADPNAGDLRLDPRAHRHQRRVPRHLAAGDHARALQPRRAVHSPRGQRTQLLEHLHPDLAQPRRTGRRSSPDPSPTCPRRSSRSTPRSACSGGRSCSRPSRWPKTAV